MAFNDVLESINNIAGIFESIAVVASLIYLARQVQDSTRTAKGTTYQGIITAFAEIESRISQDQEVARIYKVGRTELKKLTEDERVRFNEILCSFFNLYENLYYQYNNKLLEDEFWGGWCRNMRDDLAKPGINEWWSETKYLYATSFRKYVDEGKCPK